MKHFDFIVIGGGVAGLTFAREVAEYGEVAVLFKKDVTLSSTAWAQGGIAAVTDDSDDYALHIQDTITAGCDLSQPEIVELVVKEGPQRVKELIALGAKFDRSDPRHFHLHQEGGHSRRRIFHAADQTGWEIQRALLEAVRKLPSVTLLENCSAIDLITSNKVQKEKNTQHANQVLGAYVLGRSGQVQVYTAPVVLMATGGAGKVYLYTSNPDVASGDGIAMCYRAGCAVANMEFFQFHPTCLYDPRAKSFLITEAMRGEGAILKRINGERFMPTHHELAELAPRDIVARAIDFEMKAHGEDYVFLDITERDPDFVKSHFPMIYERCLQYGYDITKAPIPVVPAAHYCCGGIVCDKNGQTSIAGLYVAGEVAHTGLHGANRLASNSLLEGLVYGYRAAQHGISQLSILREQADYWCVPAWDPGDAVDLDEQVVITQNWDEIRRCMWNYVGIVRSTKRLERALRRIEMIRQEIDYYYWNFTVNSDLLELRNLALVAELVVRCALKRKESRGLHYTIDYPKVDNNYLKDTVLVGKQGALKS